MISKKLIVKSIDDAIWKCGQRLSLTKRILSTFNSFAGTIRNRKTEKAIIVDDEGKILESKNGGKTGVNIQDNVLKAFEDNDNNPVSIDHNHPNEFKDVAPSFLSVSDMDWVIAKHPDSNDFLVKSISAEDSYNHSRMSLVRGDNYSDKDEDKFIEARDYLWNNVGINSLLTHFTTTERNFEKLWGEIKDKPKVDSKEYDELMEDVKIKANNMSLEEEGFFEEFKVAQDLFRKANCRLNFEWVDD